MDLPSSVSTADAKVKANFIDILQNHPIELTKSQNDSLSNDMHAKLAKLSREFLRP